MTAPILWAWTIVEIRRLCNDPNLSSEQAVRAVLELIQKKHSDDL